MSLSDNEFYSVTIQLPENPDRRRALVTRLRLGGDFMGGVITAAGLGDVYRPGATGSSGGSCGPLDHAR
jgi:hypothetical protein